MILMPPVAAPELPPVLSYHKLSLSEFATVIIERTADIVAANPDVPVELISAIIMDGIKDELRRTPNIEVIQDVL